MSNSLLCEDDDVAAAKKGDADNVTDNEVKVVQKVGQANGICVEEVGEKADVSNGDVNIVTAQDRAVVEDIVERCQVVERINHLDVHELVRLKLHHSGNQTGRAALLSLIRSLRDNTSSGHNCYIVVQFIAIGGLRCSTLTHQPRIPDRLLGYAKCFASH